MSSEDIPEKLGLLDTENDLAATASKLNVTGHFVWLHATRARDDSGALELVALYDDDRN